MPRAFLENKFSPRERRMSAVLALSIWVLSAGLLLAVTI